MNTDGLSRTYGGSPWFSGNWEWGIGIWSPLLGRASIKNYFIPRSNPEKTSTSQLRERMWVK